MQTTTEMPTWQIFSDAGNSYRFVFSAKNSTTKNERESLKTLIHDENPKFRLPSMEDLLIQGSAKLFQNCGGVYDENAPMFRTGSGKPVKPKQASVTKALSVLGEEDASTSGRDNVYDEKAWIFRTGAGRSVRPKQSSIDKALAILGKDDVTTCDRGFSNISRNHGVVQEEKSPMFRMASGNPVQVKQSSIIKALSVLGEDNVSGDGGLSTISRNCGEIQDGKSSMFQTGFGNPVRVKQSSITKALSVLGEVDVSGSGGLSNISDSCGKAQDERSPMFQTGLGNSVRVKQSSVMKARSVLGEDNVGADGGFSSVLENCGGMQHERSPLFQTGPKRSVHVKQSPVTKARPVFGEDNATDRGFSKPLHVSGGKHDRKPGMFQTGVEKSVEVKQSTVIEAFSVPRDESPTVEGQMIDTNNRCSFSNSLFQTGSGKMVNFPSAGLMRAKTLLGLEESTDQFMANASNGWEDLSNLEERGKGHINGGANYRSVSTHPANSRPDMYVRGCESIEMHLDVPSTEKLISTGQPPPVKFQTAGGRSISVSNDALQRAMSLLSDQEFGGLPNKEVVAGPLLSFFKENSFSVTSLNKENDHFSSSLQLEPPNRMFTSKSPLPPKTPVFKENQDCATTAAFSSCSDFLRQVSENDSLHEEPRKPSFDVSCKVNPSHNAPVKAAAHVDNSLAKNSVPRRNPLGRSSGGPLVDISNNATFHANRTQVPREKRRLGKRSSVSPFKKPRSSRFSTPLTGNNCFPPNGSSTLTSEEYCCKGKIFARFPFQVARASIKDYCGEPPHLGQLDNVPPEVKFMTAETAETYMFHDASRLNDIGAEGFRHILAQSGASVQYATRDWVVNHYKWIVWKLACYERGYPAKTKRFLTVSNVLEELKYRYEREVNHAHRSVIKRILEGDASPASMVVLCISVIRFIPDGSLDPEHTMAPYEDTNKLSGSKMDESNNLAKIELTDGWYAIDAILDAPLSKQLVAGKLFVGQKLRIWKARLHGWDGPVSPLEPSKTVSLQLHINGTYRAHWADKLGICKGPGAPLAFSSIKSGGGVVPKSVVGVTRRYPILYKERLTDGGSVVRSERMETKMLHVYNQKRSTIAEGIMSESQKDISSFHCNNQNNSEEGAKLLKILEKSAEPEMIMAALSTKQLTSFANYQAKQEATRQSAMEKKIEKALEDAGLGERQVTPFLRVRVVGLTSKHSQRKGFPKEGLITIWNPTEKQKLELVEGQVYVVAGLTPLNSDSETMYLHARGSTTTWRTLPPSAIESFEPFFTPRKPVFLSHMGEVPLASEFDIAAVVVYVGEVYLSGHQKKQWVFVTDGSVSVSVSELEAKESSNCLLAISFCSSSVDNNSFAPISYDLEGSTMGFFNLIKRACDPVNHLWVAEATDNSTYSFRYDSPGYSHLKEAAGLASKWAKFSSLDFQKLKEKVLFILGNCKS